MLRTSEQPDSNPKHTKKLVVSGATSQEVGKPSQRSGAAYVMSAVTVIARSEKGRCSARWASLRQNSSTMLSAVHKQQQ